MTQMKFSEDVENKHRMITAYGDDFITIDQRRYDHSLLLTDDQPPRHWAVADTGAITAADLDPLLEANPEIVLIGTGARQHFLPPSLLHHIMQHGVGCEVMTTAAACRTFNIILGEGRRVAAGLLLG